MAQRGLWISSTLVQTRKVEMRVGELRIQGESFAVPLDRLGLAIQVFEQHGEVEQQKRLCLGSRTIDPLRFGKTTGDVQKAAQVDPRFQMTRVGLEARFVHELRLLRCGFLECKRL